MRLPATILIVYHGATFCPVTDTFRFEVMGAQIMTVNRPEHAREMLNLVQMGRESGDRVEVHYLDDALDCGATLGLPFGHVTEQPQAL